MSRKALDGITPLTRNGQRGIYAGKEMRHPRDHCRGIDELGVREFNYAFRCDWRTGTRFQCVSQPPKRMMARDEGEQMGKTRREILRLRRAPSLREGKATAHASPLRMTTKIKGKDKKKRAPGTRGSVQNDARGESLEREGVASGKKIEVTRGERRKKTQRVGGKESNSSRWRRRKWSVIPAM